MPLKDTRSNRFLEQKDVAPQNLEDSLRVHDRNVQELDERLELVSTALGDLGDIVGAASAAASISQVLASMSTVLKNYGKKMKRFNERY